MEIIEGVLVLQGCDMTGVHVCERWQSLATEYRCPVAGSRVKRDLVAGNRTDVGAVG
jgi:hypothetical protein